MTERLAAILAHLIPSSAQLPSGAVAVPAMVADPDAAPLLAALESYDNRSPADAWQTFAEADPHGASSLLHLLTAAYFAEPTVRTYYDLDRRTRPASGGTRLADLLAAVPPAPRLPKRTP